MQMPGAGDGLIRVVIADDHPVVRRGLRALLETLAGVEVVGEAEDGPGAVALVREVDPDVVLMDVNMAGGSGVEATRDICAGGSTAAVLVLTMHDDDETVRAMVRAGARGYLLKGADQEEIERALRAVASDEVIFSPQVGKQVLGLVAGVAEAGTALEGLTGRENEILALLADGYRTAAIADRLHLSPKTVSNTLTTIFAKLGVTSRAEAIVAAHRLGLSTPSGPP
jgi:DNA-binding NarL/FixJ family response regulator